MDIKEYVQKNPETVIRGTVSLIEIVKKLQGKYAGWELPEKEVPNLRMHRFNVFHLPSNEILRLTDDQLRIRCIKIPITARSAHYVAKDYVKQSPEDFIYLAYEERLRYIYSNSNRLFLEVAVARGIAERDITDETEEYQSYLFYLQTLLEEYGEKAHPSRMNEILSHME